MSMKFHSLGFALFLTTISAAPSLAAHDDGQWRSGRSNDAYASTPQWQQREDQRRREQAQWERDQEWQRQQQEELRSRAEWQQRRDEAWQREQEAIIRRQAQAQRREADHPNHYGRSHWERGRRYDGPVNVVRDWNRHQLRQPSRDQYWVRTDAGEYLLLETANRLIVDLMR